eukprot:CAMPEP_0114983240 /NCGR_PEP_ID=MMETSP0216-20121206/6583_1 /TAXON_ID=223996 /ORGANISM="Protocruzia adherens, Strain Boccale" /LENGTH=212 /DNA_ID=CAMNT_0002345187 /DNA_START=246 /DNA_END=884 /DNA_ORIENTATION=+
MSAASPTQSGTVGWEILEEGFIRCPCPCGNKHETAEYLLNLAKFLQGNIQEAVDFEQMELLPHIASSEVAKTTSEFERVMDTTLLDRDQRMELLCVPHMLDVYNFLNAFVDMTDIDVDHINPLGLIMERIIKIGKIPLNALNWRSIFLTSYKIVEELTLHGSKIDHQELHKLYPIMTQKDYYHLEVVYLQILKGHIGITANEVHGFIKAVNK